MPRQYTDLTGRRFVRWAVIHFLRTNGFQRFWLCRCDCGTEKEIPTGNLTGRVTTSCGCLKREMTSRRNRTHGLSGTREHRIWKAMNARCSQPNNPAYKNHALRGIKVCDQWRGKDGFARFLADMGPCPSPKHSIDRFPDTNGNYEPGNCRWATTVQQSRNMRTNRYLTFRGETLILTDWARKLGTSHGTIEHRIDVLGWSVEQALTTPLRQQ